MARKAQSAGPKRLGPKARRTVKALAGLLAEQYGGVLPPADLDPLGRMIYTILLEDSAVSHVRRAMRALQDACVDWNELRLHTVTEIERLLAAAQIREPAVAASRIRSLLQSCWDILRHLELERLAATDPAEIRSVIQALLGAGAGALPPQLVEYLTVLGGLDTNPPLGPGAVRVLERVGVLPPDLPQSERRKLLGEAVDDPLGLYALLHEHARKICVEDRPRCARCIVYEHCAYAQKERGEAKAVKRPKAGRSQKAAGAGAKRAASARSGSSGSKARKTVKKATSRKR